MWHLLLLGQWTAQTLYCVSSPGLECPWALWNSQCGCCDKMGLCHCWGTPPLKIPNVLWVPRKHANFLRGRCYLYYMVLYIYIIILIYIIFYIYMYVEMYVNTHKYRYLCSGKSTILPDHLLYNHIWRQFRLTLGITGEAAASEVRGVRYGFWFKFRVLHFQFRSLLMAWESSRRFDR